MSVVSTRVQRPGQARSNAVGVLGVLFLGLAAGLALVNASLGPVRHDRLEPTASAVVPESSDDAPAASEWIDRAAASPDAPPLPATTAPAEAGTALSDPPSVAEVTPSAAPSAPEPEAVAPQTPPEVAPIAPPPNAVPVHAVRMRRGRLAYIRCASGANPCPRDRALEAAVWSSLADVSSCPNITPGGSDLRLLMRPGAPPEISLRDAPGGPSLDQDVLRACIEPALAPLRTRLSEARFVVSFRFRLDDTR